MAGALAYRLFIWLLSLAVWSRARRRRRRGVPLSAGAASTVGLTGLVSSSVASAARSSARWYALLIGIPAARLRHARRLRALIVSHRLVWLDVRGAERLSADDRGEPAPARGASCMLLVSGVATGLRSSAALAGLAASLVVIVPDRPALALRLDAAASPHGRLARPRPGSALLRRRAGGSHIAAIYVIAPLADSKQGTYGSLGLAAALLLDLYLISRVAIGAAVVNATLWERRQRVLSGASTA